MNRRFSILASLVFSLGLSHMASAAGFEPSIPFGAKAAGAAGIGSPQMQGSQALYYNPAGLVADKVGNDVSLNLSAGNGPFEGPVSNTAVSEKSTAKTFFPFGLMYDRTIDDTWGFGIGAYSSGGAYANYDKLDFTGITGHPELKSSLSVVELAAGVGYKISPDLKIGVSWRVVMVDADFSQIAPLGSGSYLNLQMKDLKDTQYTGFKLGGQYKLSEKTQLGLTYRGEVGFKAKGKITKTVYTPVGNQDKGTTDVTVGSLFPAATTLGLTHQCTESWKFLGEYVFTQYSKVTNLAVNVKGSLGSPVETKFKDQHELRLGGEYSGMMMPVRFGYIYSTPVTNSKYASPTFTPPGANNIVTLGTGYDVASNMQLNAAFEYDWSQGNGAAGVTAPYKLTGYGYHLGAQYNF